MQVVSKSGRVFDVPNAADEAKIRQGIAGDEGNDELADADLACLCSAGRPESAEAKQAMSPEALTDVKITGHD
jgi:hypothetical protein